VQSLIASEAGIRLHTEDDVLDLGSIFQKLVNYRFTVAIVLPADHGFGPRVTELAREHRHHPVIRFFATLDEAEAWAKNR
jgi:hypothetical protein